MIRWCTSTLKGEINWWKFFRFYFSLTPVFNNISLIWYIWKLSSFTKPQFVRQYSEVVNVKSQEETDNEGIELREMSSNETKGKVLSIAQKYRYSKEEYSTYAREFYYILVLIGFGQDIPQLVLEVAFVFRDDVSGTIWYWAAIPNVIGFTIASVNIFYLLPRKHFEFVPYSIPWSESLKFGFLLFFANISRLYGLIYFFTFAKWSHECTWVIIVVLLLLNLLLAFCATDELNRNPEFTTLFIIFNLISPCISPTQCKTASLYQASLGIMLAILPELDFYIFNAVIPIFVFSGILYLCFKIVERGFLWDRFGWCGKVLTLFCWLVVLALFGLCINAPLHYWNISKIKVPYLPEFKDCLKTNLDESKKVREYLTPPIKGGITIVTGIISVTFFPYLADYFNHPDSFGEDHFLDQFFRKIFAWCSKNNEQMYLREEHFYMRGLVDHLYLGRIPPTFEQRKKFLWMDEKMKEFTGLSLLQWSIKEGYFHLARYLVVRYKVQIEKADWHEACKKGWVEFLEMLVHQVLPKIPSEGCVTKCIIKVIRCICCLGERGYPKDQPSSLEETKIAIEKLSPQETKPSWIDNLFSEDNSYLRNAINDEKDEMGKFLKVVYDDVRNRGFDPKLSTTSEMAEDNEQFAQDIMEIQTFGWPYDTCSCCSCSCCSCCSSSCCSGLCRSSRQLEKTPQDVCKELEFSRTHGFWTVHSYDWSENGDNVNYGDCCTRIKCHSLFYCFNKEKWCRQEEEEEPFRLEQRIEDCRCEQNVR